MCAALCARLSCSRGFLGVVHSVVDWCGFRCLIVFCKAEDGIRDLVRSRGLGDVYKRQQPGRSQYAASCRKCLGQRRGGHGDSRDAERDRCRRIGIKFHAIDPAQQRGPCLLYTSDAADERSSVDFGGRRIIKQKKNKKNKKRAQIVHQDKQ